VEPPPYAEPPPPAEPESSYYESESYSADAELGQMLEEDLGTLLRDRAFRIEVRPQYPPALRLVARLGHAASRNYHVRVSKLLRRASCDLEEVLRFRQFALFRIARHFGPDCIRGLVGYAPDSIALSSEVMKIILESYPTIERYVEATRRRDLSVTDLISVAKERGPQALDRLMASAGTIRPDSERATDEFVDLMVWRMGVKTSDHLNMWRTWPLRKTVNYRTVYSKSAALGVLGRMKTMRHLDRFLRGLVDNRTQAHFASLIYVFDLPGWKVDRRLYETVLDMALTSEIRWEVCAYGLLASREDAPPGAVPPGLLVLCYMKKGSTRKLKALLSSTAPADAAEAVGLIREKKSAMSKRERMSRRGHLKAIKKRAAARE
jgi:hypothetical protein